MRHQLGAPEHPYTGITSLLDLFDGSFEAVGALLQVASTSIEADVRRIEAGLAAGDATAVADAAHRLKGTSGSISAQRLADISSSIERDARERAIVRATARVPDLRAAVDSLAETIASYGRDRACGALASEAS